MKLQQIICAKIKLGGKIMNNPIISVQGSGKKLIMIGIAIIIFTVIITTVFSFGIEGSRNADELAMTTTIIDLLIKCVGIFIIVIGAKFSKTYISVFENYIQGEGLINFTRASFSLSYDKISSVSVNKDKLLINSNGVIYKIGVSSSDASRIAKYINNRI